MPESFLPSTSTLLGNSFSRMSSWSPENSNKQNSTVLRACLTFLLERCCFPRQLKLELNPWPRKRRVRESFCFLGAFRDQDRGEEGASRRLLQNCAGLLNLDLTSLRHIINVQCIPHTWKHNTSHRRVSLKLGPSFVSFACSSPPINLVSPGQVS